MKRFFVTLLLLSPCVWGEEPWARRVEVPPGVRYKQASEAELRPQALALQAGLKPGARQAPFGESCLCGPYLWQRWRSHFPARAGVPMTSRIQTPQGELALQGRAFHKDAAGLREVVAQLREELNGGFTLRKLTPAELAAFWTEFPFDLADPVWIAETPSTRIVLVLVEKQVFYLELLDANFGKKL